MEGMHLKARREGLNPVGSRRCQLFGLQEKRGELQFPRTQSEPHPRPAGSALPRSRPIVDFAVSVDRPPLAYLYEARRARSLFGFVRTMKIGFDLKLFMEAAPGSRHIRCRPVAGLGRFGIAAALVILFTARFANGASTLLDYEKRVFRAAEQVERIKTDRAYE